MATYNEYLMDQNRLNTAAQATVGASVNPQAALAKLTSGRADTLTPAERKYLNLPATPAPTKAASSLPTSDTAASKTPATYKTATIYDRQGNPVVVYTEGPNAGRSVETGALVLQGEKPGDIPAKPAVSAATQALDNTLANTLKSYGMEGIDKVVAQIRADYPEISQSDLLSLLKNDTRYNKLYTTRFAGNAKLKAAGLPTLDDATYLKTEKEYEKIFKAYGVTNLANRDYYATLIGNSMDAVDVSSRIDLAYKVYKGNPQVKNAFNTFYGTVTDGDVVAAMLDPVTQVPLLQKKITVAEIGGAALQQNLSTSLARASELEAFGVTAAQAQAGYQAIAQGLPTYEKLLEMKYGEDIATVDAQTMLEKTKFKKNAKALQEEQAIVGEEVARFGGTSGRLRSQNRTASQGVI